MSAALRNPKFAQLGEIKDKVVQLSSFKESAFVIDAPPKIEGNVVATESEMRASAMAEIEARTDTKIARLEGKFETLTATILGRIDNLREAVVRDHEYNRTTRWVIVGLFLALFASFVAVISYGGDQWSRGLSTRDLIQTTIKDYDATRRPVPEQ
jgi:hypothetical protein